MFNLLNYVLDLFLLIWFICGCAWVYGSYDWIDFEQDTEAHIQNYCNSIVFWFAFLVLTVQIIAVVLAIFAFILFGAVVFIMAK